MTASCISKHDHFCGWQFLSPSVVLWPFVSSCSMHSLIFMPATCSMTHYLEYTTTIYWLIWKNSCHTLHAINSLPKGSCVETSTQKRHLWFKSCKRILKICAFWVITLGRFDWTRFVFLANNTHCPKHTVRSSLWPLGHT